MQCMQVWGGSEATDTSVSTTGLDLWLFSKPHGGDDEGGDVCLLSSCSSGRITRLALTDVRGHGQGVRALAGGLRRLMGRHIDRVDQRALVRAVNREFVALGDESTFATGLFATYFAPSGSVALTNAGHPPPLLFNARRQRWGPLEMAPSLASLADVPLGLFEKASYVQVDVPLGPDDLVLCYTDGLEECVDEEGQMLGQDGLLKLLAAADMTEPSRLIPRILERVRLKSPENLSHDDVTIVLMRPNVFVPSVRDNLLAPFRYVANLIGARSWHDTTGAASGRFSMAVGPAGRGDAVENRGGR